MPAERILFVTGRLAEPSLARVLASLGSSAGFESQVAVLPISVAALMHVEWVHKKLEVPLGIDRILLPGWCQGDLSALAAHLGIACELGPKDVHDLPEYFGRRDRPVPDLSQFTIDIIAEINHAPRLSDAEILEQARSLRASGADVIDLGCIPGESWPRAGDVTRLLRGENLRVSIDSFERREVESAVHAGAELVLSCNRSNRDWAAELPAELVAIPDEPHDLESLAETVQHLEAHGARFRIDPILEPIGFGFAASLARYFEVRRRFPQAAMMMGIGNLTELTEVDSAGANMLLAAFCQELQISSVLTTQVINWCRSAVREFDVARRLAHYAITNQTLPKHLGAGLLMLRDRKLRDLGAAEMELLSARIKDPNFRIFAERGEIHILNRDGYWHGTDPFELYDRLTVGDPQHAFYLGFELAKALTALTLGKNYIQDEALDWGVLSQPETSAKHRRRMKEEG